MNSPATTYLSLGSNMGCREANLREAVRRISDLPGTDVEAVSSFLETGPEGIWNGVPEQNFVNCCVRVKTALEPLELLHALKVIEEDMGRVCAVRYDGSGRRVYSDRPIDIDILLYSDLSLDSEELKIPHPRMQERDFVMKPLGEVLL